MDNFYSLSLSKKLLTKDFLELNTLLTGLLLGLWDDSEEVLLFLNLSLFFGGSGLLEELSVGDRPGGRIRSEDGTGKRPQPAKVTPGKAGRENFPPPE